MRACPRPILLATLLTSACTEQQLGTPSLAPRASEAIDPRVPVVSDAPVLPADATLTARLAALMGTARQGEAAFSAAIAEAERLAGSAGQPQSESWVIAQQALSVAVAARAPTTRAVGDIDEIAATRLAERGGILPGDLAAIRAAAAEVAGIDQRQADRIERLQARLGG